MKRKKLLFLILFMACFFPAVLIGCTIESKMVPDDYHKAGYQRVVFYYNGGVAGSFSYMNYYIKNSETGGAYTFPVPGSDVAIPSKSGYNFYGWYEVDFDAFAVKEELIMEEYLDDEGETKTRPVKNIKNEDAKMDIPYLERKNSAGDVLDTYSANKILTLKDYEDETSEDYDGERLFVGPWNFDFDKVTKDVCLVALWEPRRYFVVVPPENSNDIFDAEGYNGLPLGKIEANGALIKPTGSSLPKKKGFQVEDFYLDRACTIRVQFDKNSSYYPKAEFVEGTETFKIFPIYTKWISAKYIKVESASAIRNIASNASYYIMRNLDFTGINLSVPEVYSGEIRGNDKIWSNLSIRVDEIERITESFYIYGGVFKNLSGAKISGITFENLNITFVRRSPHWGDTQTWKSEVRFNIFAKSIDELCEIKNIKLGVDENDSSFMVTNTIEFNEHAYIDRDQYGNPYRVSYAGTSFMRVAVKKDAYGDPIYDGDGQPVYPEEGEVINGIEIEYRKTRLGEYYLDTVVAVDELDGRALWCNEILQPPSFAPEMIIGQSEETNFGINSENIVGCVNKINIKEMPLPWLVEYSGGNEPRPLSAQDYTSKNDLEWAGWYFFDEASNSYKKFDFASAQPGATVVLTAMWKETIK